MNGKVLLLLMLLFGGFLSVCAQNDGRVVVKGRITDASTGEPVAFANLGLLGTVAGVASDMDGKFELSVPDKYSTYLIRVSAVGYASYEIKVYEAKDKDLQIKLQPVTYGIGEVDVFAKSLVYKKMIKDAVNSISRNYIMKPYNYEGYFKYGITTDDAPEEVKDAVVTIYDSKGYQRSDVAATFGEINYTFDKVRRSQPAQSVYDGLTYLDDILTADVVRHTRNVLDLANERDYELKNKGQIVYEGDSLQVIGYEVLKPSLSTTGDASVTKFSGEIFINKKDKAILKNVMRITSKDFTVLGRNLIPVKEAPKSGVKMTIVTNYKKLKSVYFLSGVNIGYSYTMDGKKIKGEMEYITTRVNMTTPKVITGRSYYENMKQDDEFWKRYSVYFEGEQ